MISNSNYKTCPNTLSYGAVQVDPLIQNRELAIILKEWVNNPLTNVSGVDVRKILEKIVGFYRKETNPSSAMGMGTLEITGVQAQCFPEIFSYSPFRHLTNLTLQMGLSQLPESIYHLHQLQSLDLSNNKLDRVSEKLGDLCQLKELNLSYNEFSELPNRFDTLRQLTHVQLVDNKLTELPTSFSQLGHLTHLNLSSNLFSHMPTCLLQLKELQELNLSKNQLTTLPENICQLKQIKLLDLLDNKFTHRPKSLEQIYNQNAVIINIIVTDIIEVSNSSPAEKRRKRKAEKFHLSGCLPRCSKNTSSSV